jgi:outer membrane protein OmpA-like peptidoglycan-associated protein
MNASIRAIALTALVAAPAALAQTTTAVHARSYVLSAFITGAAHAIISDTVTLSPALRERLALAPTADSRAIYEALIALTENKPLSARQASPEESRVALKAANRALIALEAGEVKLLLEYDLERNNIAYITEPMQKTIAVAAAPAQASRQAKVIRLSPIHFEFDQAMLDRVAQERLEQEALPKLVALRDIRYVVRGHADDIGTAEYNEPLSRRRAEAVRDYLASKGAEPAKIDVIAVGSAMPEVDCPVQPKREALLACRARNRRVEVEIHLPPF